MPAEAHSVTYSLAHSWSTPSIALLPHKGVQLAALSFPQGACPCLQHAQVSTLHSALPVLAIVHAQAEGGRVVV